MGITTRENSKITRHTGSVNKLHQLDTLMMAIGSKIDNRGRARRHSQRAQTLKGNFKMVLKQDLENLSFQMGPSMYSAKTRYKGSIVNNKFNGKGIFYFADGRIYDGSWKDNQMEGYGTFTWPDGRIYDGYVTYF